MIYETFTDFTVSVETMTFTTKAYMYLTMYSYVSTDRTNGLTALTTTVCLAKLPFIVILMSTLLQNRIFNIGLCID